MSKERIVNLDLLKYYDGKIKKWTGDQIGVLANLKTTAKSDAVSAINELVDDASVNAAAAAAAQKAADDASVAAAAAQKAADDASVAAAAAQKTADDASTAAAAAQKTADDASTAAAAAMTEAEAKVASVEAGDSYVKIGGTATAPTVALDASKITNTLSAGSDDALVTLAAVKGLGTALHYAGMGASFPATATQGDIFIKTAEGQSPVEYIYDGTNWQEFGNEGLYATKAQLGDLTALKTTTKSDAVSSINEVYDDASAAKKAADDASAAAAAAMTEAQAKVASVGAGDGYISIGGTDTAPTVALDADKIEGADDATTYSNTNIATAAYVDEKVAANAAKDSTITLRYTDASGATQSISSFTLNQASDASIDLFDVVTTSEIDALFD